MPAASCQSRPARSKGLFAHHGDERLQRLLAGFILVQAAFCGLTICLVLRGISSTLLEVAIVSTGLLMAFATVAWLAQETRTRTSRRARLRRRVERRLLARSIRQERAAAAIAAQESRSFGDIRAETPLSVSEWTKDPFQQGADASSRSRSDRAVVQGRERWNDSTVQMTSPRLSALVASPSSSAAPIDAESLA